MKIPSHTSIHEIGHALVAYALCEKIVEIVKEGDGRGYCKIYHIKNKYRIKDKIKMSCVMVAGHFAEVVFCKQDIKFWPEEDHKALQKIGTTIEGVNVIKEPIIKFLKRHKNTIFHLALILDEKGRIGRNTFYRLLRDLGWKA